MNNGNLPTQYPSTSQRADTLQYFNNLYDVKYDLATDVNDAIVGYFEEFTGEKKSAAVLASTVIYTALSRGTDPMAILEKFRELPIRELDLYVAAFLNLSRTNTSLLGVKNRPQASFFVQRSILA
jgi:hypothetical protein